MEKPTKILVIGLVGSALCLIVGFIDYKHNQQDLKTLIAHCESGDLAPWDKDYSVKPRFGGTLICAPNELIKIRSNSMQKGVQKKIVEAHQSIGNNWDFFCMIALILAGISAIPYAWYFFLQRLRELRDALR